MRQRQHGKEEEEQSNKKTFSGETKTKEEERKSSIEEGKQCQVRFLFSEEKDEGVGLTGKQTEAQGGNKHIQKKGKERKCRKINRKRREYYKKTKTVKHSEGQ